MALSVVLALILASPMALGQVEQSSKASGKTGELAADWWQWASSKPQGENPIVGGSYTGGPKCDGRPVGDTPGRQWFLAGTTDGSSVKRTCTVPAGTQLFFPVVNTVFLITEPDEDEEFARQAVNDFMDEVLADPEFRKFVTVDGKQVKRKHIQRADSPLFTATLPDNNIFGQEPGPYDGVADGLWVSLPPLSKGKHTIHFGMSAPNAGFEQDNTYRLKVERSRAGEEG